jgi:hypothetical protein
MDREEVLEIEPVARSGSRVVLEARIAGHGDLPGEAPVAGLDPREVIGLRLGPARDGPQGLPGIVPAALGDDSAPQRVRDPEQARDVVAHVGLERVALAIIGVIQVVGARADRFVEVEAVVLVDRRTSPTAVDVDPGGREGISRAEVLHVLRAGRYATEVRFLPSVDWTKKFVDPWNVHCASTVAPPWSSSYADSGTAPRADAQRRRGEGVGLELQGQLVASAGLPGELVQGARAVGIDDEPPSRGDLRADAVHEPLALRARAR